MTPEQRDLLIAYALGRLSYDEYVAHSGVALAGDSGFLERELREAARERDGAALEWLLILGFKLELFNASLAPLLGALLLESWHMKHEDLASALQRLREPCVVDLLAAAAVTKPDYLALVDDAHAFARKCIWALADIGSIQARQHLLELSQHADSELAGYAQRRLDRWDQEMGRKAPDSRKLSDADA